MAATFSFIFMVISIMAWILIAKSALKENKWIGIGGIALKPFIVKYRGHIEEGNNYVEWKAIFKENLPKWDQN